MEKNILLTGRPGIGKTTLINGVVNTINKKFGFVRVNLGNRESLVLELINNSTKKEIELNKETLVIIQSLLEKFYLRIIF